MKPLVYVAGPYTSPDPVGNVRRAIAAAEQIEELGADVFIPHLSMLWDLVSPAPYERWCERDNVILARCEALYRMHGDSLGADFEIEFAHEHDIPVFVSLSDLSTFIARWSTTEPLRQGVLS